MTLNDDAHIDRIGDRIFVNEDLGRLENRINVALFGLMAQDWFRTWVLRNLGVPTYAIVFPPTNVGPQRPDFTIADPCTGKTIGWIEVETDSDSGQLRRYEQHFECVKSIWGRSGDLSLERISSRLKSELDAKNLAPQSSLSVLLLRKLIEQALAKDKSPSKPVQVSEQMRRRWLIQALTRRLGDRLDFDLKSAVPGRLKANARKKHGFSLRVFSRNASDGDISILNIRGGAEEIRFSSRDRLQRYLPVHRADAIAAWCDLLRRIGVEIDQVTVDWVPARVRRTEFGQHEAEFAKCLLRLSRSA